jgi:uncharacterized protein (TIGR03643 family)
VVTVADGRLRDLRNQRLGIAQHQHQQLAVAVESQFGLGESDVITLMRRTLKPGSFRLWRARVSGRQTKHLQLRDPNVSRGYCPTQYKQR